MMNLLFVFAALAALPSMSAGAEGLTRTSTEFHFTADLAYADAAPLFGAWEEQKWAKGWKPQFLYPTPPVDQEGSVFRVERDGHHCIWVNTVFDLPGGHVQYVYVLGDLLVTRIDIHLKKNGSDKTDVLVVYERTALNSTANQYVRELAKSDAESAESWRAAINDYGRNRKPRQ